MDSDAEHNLGWYKIHFDMLRLMTPMFHEDANDKVCKITLKDWDEGTGPHLDAYPMEGESDIRGNFMTKNGKKVNTKRHETIKKILSIVL